MRLKNGLIRNEILAYRTTEEHTISPQLQQQKPDCTTLKTPAVNGEIHEGLGIDGHGTLIVPSMPEIGEEKEAEEEAEAEIEIRGAIAPSQQLDEP